MPATLQSSAVVVPDSTTQQGAAAVEAFLTFCSSQPSANVASPKLVLDDGRAVEVPLPMFDLLRQLAAMLAAGNAVTISSIAKEITTSEAATLLGMSRPTLIKLLDTDQIPSRRVGTHRRIPVQDVLDFRRRRLLERRKSYAALMEECDALGIDE